MKIKILLPVAAFLAVSTSCNSNSGPTEYTIALTGMGGVGICWTERGYENETMCESEGVYMPGQPSKPRTGISLPAKSTRVSSRNLYFTIELVTASEVNATMLRAGQVCRTTTLTGLGQKFQVSC